MHDRDRRHGEGHAGQAGGGTGSGPGAGRGAPPEMTGAEPGSVGAVFASANSTRGLDAVESAALRLAFDGAPPPVCSVRGAIGESGAAGAASAVAACFALAEGRLPGTAGLSETDPALGLDAAPGARRLAAGRVLVTGFSRGGSAVALVLGAA